MAILQRCSIGINVRLLSASGQSERYVAVQRHARVLVKALFENLEDGAGVDDFLRWFPGVKREHVLAVREFAEQSLTVA